MLDTHSSQDDFETQAKSILGDVTLALPSELQAVFSARTQSDVTTQDLLYSAAGQLVEFKSLYPLAAAMVQPIEDRLHRLINTIPAKLVA